MWSLVRRTSASRVNRMRSKYSDVRASETFTVRQMPLKMTASQGRCSRASANAPT